MFEFIAACCNEHALAWDCATGNGQAARSLQPYFRKIIATDASERQIASAVATDGIEFGVARAEHSALVESSVDLVTVAQALHWFDIGAFFAEAKRVLKPGGVLAFWCYQNCNVDRDIDAACEQIFAEVDDFWPPERDIVEEQYPSLDMPFDDLAADEFSMTTNWTADDLLNYMRTWSASQRYIVANGNDPTEICRGRLKILWGDGRRTVNWPITIRIGRNSGA